MKQTGTSTCAAIGLCLLLALLAHLPLGVLTTPILQRPGIPYSTPAHFSIRPIGHGAQDTPPWSPILFSLPTPAGFSGQTPNEPKKSSPPLEGRPPEDVLLGRPAWTQHTTARPLGPPETPIQKPAMARQTSYQTARPKGWHLRFPGHVQRTDFTKAELPGLEAFPIEATLQLWLKIDEEGLVKQVLLESGSGDTNVDAAVVRALFTWQGRPGPEPRSGPVELRIQQGGAS